MKASRITAVGLVAATALWIGSGYLIPHESAESQAALKPGEAKPEKRFRVAARDPGMWGAVRGLVRRRYREVIALHGVSFGIEAGEIVGYIGPNGAGKSTTIKILSGILTPSGGRCTVNGLVPWRDRVAHVARIGVVFGQRTQLWWDLPVAESFDLLRDIYRVDRARFVRMRATCRPT